MATKKAKKKEAKKEVKVAPESVPVPEESITSTTSDSIEAPVELQEINVAFKTKHRLTEAQVSEVCSEAGRQIDIIGKENSGEKVLKKVAIVGCSDSKSLAPFNDPEFEIWGVNNAYHVMPEFNNKCRWFEIHDITHDGKNFTRREGKDFRGQSVDQYLDQLGTWAEKKNCPVYMQKQWDNIPTSTPFPVQDILNRFGNYFTNSISWQLALAIHEGFTEIHVYGVDMAVGTEYHHQRASCEYFLGLAKGMGIKIHVPDEADLLKSRFLYGFDEPKILAFDRKINKTLGMLEEKIHKEDAIINAAKARKNQYVGAKLATGEVHKVWSECNGDVDVAFKAVLQGSK